LARHVPQGYEGMTEWLSQIVVGHLFAQQAGCRLLIDYNSDIDIHQILSPHLHSEDWTVPADFRCLPENRCVIAPHFTMDHVYSRVLEATGKKTLANVPWYRYASRNETGMKIYRHVYQALEIALPGFQLETGMACSLGSLLCLAPTTASQYEPNLVPILSTLQDEKALVMGIYIRSGFTDTVASWERIGKVAKEDMETSRQQAAQTIECALKLEEQYLSEHLSFTKIVWMLTTDSVNLKQWIFELYNGKDANAHTSSQNRRTSKVIPRTVVVTRAKGAHTRTRRNVTTADLAEALIDWYLLGESDLVIASSSWYTFGATAALRTVRPFYNASTCSKIVFVHDN